MNRAADLDVVSLSRLLLSVLPGRLSSFYNWEGMIMGAENRASWAGRQAPMAIERFRGRLGNSRNKLLGESSNMRRRNKVLILLFTVVLALWTVVLSHPVKFDNAVSDRTAPTVQHLKHILTPLLDGTSLWYGGVSLFAMIIIVLLLRAARGVALRASRERSTRVEAANTDAEKLFSPNWRAAWVKNRSFCRAGAKSWRRSSQK
jgi:hypothetical protein